ncbi:MAG: hypothetical protein MUP52_11935 [Candidatus Aminicenantes bacterium]|nr:hypothetical protein [Candidatus Aminicenantes bacterium]
MADIKYIVECDASGALKSIKDLDQTINTAAGTTAKAGGSSGPFGSLFAQFTAGTLAASALQKGIGALKDVVAGVIEGAIESEKAENDLRAALELTGRTIEGNIQHYLDFAQAQMKVTTYDDEQIKSSQALLLQLTNLNQKGIDRATKGAMGLASTMGIDLHSATMMVTKAMEGNYGALGRVGIRVGENLTAEQKQALLLDQLEKLYGRSTKEVDTFGGAIKQMGNMWNEAKEAVGGAIIKNEAVRDLIKEITDKIIKLAESAKFKEWIDGASAALEEFLPKFVNTVAKVIEYAGKAAQGIQDASNIMQGTLFFNSVDISFKEKSRAAQREAEKFVASLKTLHPQMREVQAAMEAGRDNWAAYVKWMRDADEKAIALAKQNKNLKPTIDEIGTGTKNLTAEQIKAADAAKKAGDALAKAAQDIINKYRPLHAAMKAVFDEQKVLTAAFKAGVITEAQYKSGMDASTKSLRAFGDTITTAILPKVKNMREVFAKAVVNMVAGPPKITKSWFEEAPKWVTTVENVMTRVQAASMTAINAIEAAMQQSLTNKLAMLDEEYQARLDLITQSVMNETEKEAAITALDAEYSMKRRKAEVDAAKKAKIIAIAEAIINTAEGVTKAWAQGGAIFGPILAAIVAAAGAVQIALIRSQPIGAAKGAIFKQKALLMSQASGQEYEVAEGGEAEIVSSPRQLREAIMGKGRGKGPGQQVTLHNHIYIDGKEMKTFITKTIRELSKAELMQIHPRAVRAY